MRIADVGTGSGAVAIALAVNRPNVEVWATDTSAAAVELARENAKLHGVEDRVHVRPGRSARAAHRSPSTSSSRTCRTSRPSKPDPRYENEPPEAVYAPGDGLDPYRRLLNACRDGKLETGGTLLIQFHRDPLAANCWELEDLREQLESSA